LGISWSTLHYKPAEPKPRDITLMRLLDEQYTDTPFYGVRRMTEHLKGCGFARRCCCLERARVSGNNAGGSYAFA